MQPLRVLDRFPPSEAYLLTLIAAQNLEMIREEQLLTYLDRGMGIANRDALRITASERLASRAPDCRYGVPGFFWATSDSLNRQFDSRRSGEMNYSNFHSSGGFGGYRSFGGGGRGRR